MMYIIIILYHATAGPAMHARTFCLVYLGAHHPPCIDLLGFGVVRQAKADLVAGLQCQVVGHLAAVEEHAPLPSAALVTTG